MGYTELLFVLCFAVTIWSNTANTDIDCRKFVFAPSCRGVSAKRSWSRLAKHDSQRLEANLAEDGESTDEGENSFKPIKFAIRSHKKRFEDLLKSSLLRRQRPKSLNGLRLLSPYTYMNENLGSNDDD